MRVFVLHSGSLCRGVYGGYRKVWEYVRLFVLRSVLWGVYKYLWGRVDVSAVWFSRCTCNTL